MNKIRKVVRKLFYSGGDYDEWSYWNNRADPNAPRGWTSGNLQPVLDFIRRHTSDCESLLEVGPGVGRTLDAYQPGRELRAYDITTIYRDRLLDRARELNLSIVFDVAKEPNQELPYHDKQFDVAVASQVLLHQRPNRIETLMKELARVSWKVVVVTGGYGRSATGKHVFAHDYPVICTRIGCEMNSVQARPPDLFFVYNHVKE